MLSISQDSYGTFSGESKQFKGYSVLHYTKDTLDFLTYLGLAEYPEEGWLFILDTGELHCEASISEGSLLSLDGMLHDIYFKYAKHLRELYQSFSVYQQAITNHKQAIQYTIEAYTNNVNAMKPILADLKNTIMVFHADMISAANLFTTITSHKPRTSVDSEPTVSQLGSVICIRSVGRAVIPYSASIDYPAVHDYFNLDLSKFTAESQSRIKLYYDEYLIHISDTEIEYTYTILIHYPSVLYNEDVDTIMKKLIEVGVKFDESDTDS